PRQLAHDPQAQPVAAAPLRGGAALEPFEDLLLLRQRDARSAVGHRDLRGVADLLDRDAFGLRGPYLSALESKLETIWSTRIASNRPATGPSASTLTALPARRASSDDRFTVSRTSPTRSRS